MSSGASAHRLTPPSDLREKLAQLLMVRLGSNIPPVRTVEDDEKRVAELLHACPVGGLVLFNGSLQETPRTLERLQRVSRRPMLIAADFERGAGQQLAGLPLVPHAMAFDALGDVAEEAVRRFGEATGAASWAAGVHMPFAPVADVNSDPRNPIIATRAFGTEPQRVSRLVAAFVAGCLAGGALPTAKHFPGHGDTQVDSHHALPSVAATRSELEARDLAPFRAAIAAGAPAVMTAHVQYPALDASGCPATYSHAILTDLLRGELGFDGVVVSDSFLMEGARVGAEDEGQRAVRAIAAGVDMIVDVAEPAVVLEALAAAVRAGRLSEARVDEALARIWRLKQRMFAPDGGSSAPLDDQLREQTEALALDVARRATTVVKNTPGVLPFDPGRSLGAVLVNSFPRSAYAPAPPLGDYLAGAFSQLSYFEIGASPSSTELERAAEAAQQADQLLLAVVVKPAAWHQFGLPAWAVQWLKPLASRRDAVAACLGAPQGLADLSDAAIHICTFSDVAASQQALVEKLTSRPA